jgi:histidinol phosphatase-like PHP family hydrolase
METHLEYVQRFIDKGGYMITLGSDAHISKNAAQGFDELIPKLLEMGIKQAYYFEERVPIAYSLEL